MKTLLTGASGLIGSALASDLSNRGHDVVRLVRSEPEAEALLWDPEAGTLESSGLEGLDWAVHLAGENIASKRWSESKRTGSGTVGSMGPDSSPKPLPGSQIRLRC